MYATVGSIKLKESPRDQRTFSGDAPPIRARFDAAQTTDEYKNYWAASDSLDADSSASRGVRNKLVSRSRYEIGNNAYVDGMVQTHANYTVGVGPSLRMMTGVENLQRPSREAMEELGPRLSNCAANCGRCLTRK